MVAGKAGPSLCPFQLCSLHADMLISLGPKEARKAFLDFYHSFLEKTAVSTPGEVEGRWGPCSSWPTSLLSSFHTHTHPLF